MSKGEAEKKPWEAKIDKIDRIEFEEARRCLLNSYHSYVQTHAGYIIAIIVGLLALISALISNFESFSKSPIALGFFIAFISLIVGAFFFMWARIEYWTRFANGSLDLTLDDVVLLFNYRNFGLKPPSQYSTEPPYTAILQYAIYQHIRIVNPRVLVSAERCRGLIYWILMKRKEDMDTLIEEAKKNRNVEQWKKAYDNLEIAYKIASSLKNTSKQEEIKNLQKEMSNEDVPFFF